jgi:cytochrome c553
MSPGGACIACHDNEGQGPDSVAGGPVSTGLHEPDDCIGPRRITAERTGAAGSAFTAETNQAGNVVFEADDAHLVMPDTAIGRVGENEREKFVERDSGDCNSCHTVEGAEDAPERITP